MNCYKIRIFQSGFKSFEAREFYNIIQGLTILKLDHLKQNYLCFYRYIFIIIKDK